MKRLGTESDFYKDFNFVGSVKDYQKDTWDEVLRYMKPKSSVNINEKIAKIRLEQKEKKKVCIFAFSEDECLMGKCLI